jgi:thiol-disulfide isomerase/thioredoxin
MRFSFLAALPVLVLTAPVLALDSKPYDKAAFTASQAAGKRIIVEIHADWCPTCQKQSAIFDGLKSDPRFQNVVVYRIDFDAQKDVVKEFGARSQSTLIVFKGAKETGRSVGSTDPKAIEMLLASAS